MLEEVKKAIEKISAAAWDDEAAHSQEDELYEKILRALASGALGWHEAQECAKEALKTKEMDFSRWCA